MVPLEVRLGERVVREGVDVDAAELSAALADRELDVQTSRPAPAEFAAGYREALDAGADAVVSVHLSRELSGTWDAARLAADEIGGDRVRVVDSRATAMGLGYAVLAAGRRRRLGCGRRCRRGRRRRRRRPLPRVLLRRHPRPAPPRRPDRRGGRARSAPRCPVKPLLHVVRREDRPAGEGADDGRPATQGSSSWRRGQARTRRPRRAPPRRGDAGRGHGDRLRERLPGTRLLVSEVGAVIGGARRAPGLLGCGGGPRAARRVAALRASRGLAGRRAMSSPGR